MIKNYTKKQYNDIVTYFCNYDDNRQSVISKKLNIPLHVVSYILNIHLSKKNKKPIK